MSTTGPQAASGCRPSPGVATPLGPPAGLSMLRQEGGQPQQRQQGQAKGSLRECAVRASILGHPTPGLGRLLYGDLLATFVPSQPRRGVTA